MVKPKLAITPRRRPKKLSENWISPFGNSGKSMPPSCGPVLRPSQRSAVVAPLNWTLNNRRLRSKARLVRILIVPAGALASTSALIVFEISIESMPASDTPSKLKTRAEAAPVFASAEAMLVPFSVTCV